MPHFVPYEGDLDAVTQDLANAELELLDAQAELEWFEREVRVKHVSVELQNAKNDTQRSLIVQQRFYQITDNDTGQLVWYQLSERIKAAKKQVAVARLLREDLHEKVRAASRLGLKGR